MRKMLTTFSLFTSTATLVCCALPALFVALGAGAALAGLVGNFPQLIWVSENKSIVFTIGAALLIAGGILQKQAKTKVCPIDPELAEACKNTRDLSVWIYWSSVVIYLIGAFFAFVTPYILS